MPQTHAPLEGAMGWAIGLSVTIQMTSPSHVHMLSKQRWVFTYAFTDFQRGAFSAMRLRYDPHHIY